MKYSLAQLRAMLAERPVVRVALTLEEYDLLDEKFKLKQFSKMAPNGKCIIEVRLKDDELSGLGVEMEALRTQEKSK